MSRRRPSFVDRANKYANTWRELVEGRSPIVNNINVPNGASNRERIDAHHAYWNKQLEDTRNIDVFSKNIMPVEFPSANQAIKLVTNPYLDDTSSKNEREYYYQKMPIAPLLARILWAFPERLQSKQVLVSWASFVLTEDEQRNVTVSVGRVANKQALFKDTLDYKSLVDPSSPYKLLFIESVYPSTATRKLGHMNVTVIHRSEDGSLLASHFEPYGVNVSTMSCFAKRGQLLRELRRHLPDCKVVHATDCDSDAIGMQRLVSTDPGLCIYFSIYYCLMCAMNPSKIGYIARKMTMGVSDEEMKAKVSTVLSLAMRFSRLNRAKIVRETGYIPKHLDHMAFDYKGQNDDRGSIPMNQDLTTVHNIGAVVVQQMGAGSRPSSARRGPGTPTKSAAIDPFLSACR